jgi:hypothetical protein
LKKPPPHVAANETLPDCTASSTIANAMTASAQMTPAMKAGGTGVLHHPIKTTVHETAGASYHLSPPLAASDFSMCGKMKKHSDRRDKDDDHRKIGISAIKSPNRPPTSTNAKKAILIVVRVENTG